MIEWGKRVKVRVRVAARLRDKVRVRGRISFMVRFGSVYG